MNVGDAMAGLLLIIGPDLTIQEAARKMRERDVGAVVVMDVDGYAPGILTERDVLRCVAEGADVTTELVRDHQTNRLTTATEDTAIDWAADRMLTGGFRHIVVVDEAGEPTGMLSIRDIVRAYAEARQQA